MKKHFFYLCVWLFTCVNVEAQQPRISIQWMPLTDDEAYLDDVLKVAEDYDVDGFQISHNLMHSIDELVYPDKERRMISPGSRPWGASW